MATTPKQTAVVTTRVPTGVAKTIKLTALVNGVSEAEVMRLWLEEMAAKASISSLAAKYENQLTRQRQEVDDLVNDLSSSPSRRQD